MIFGRIANCSSDERKEGVPASLSASAYLTVLAIAFSLFALLGWALIRLESGDASAAGRVPYGRRAPTTA